MTVLIATLIIGLAPHPMIHHHHRRPECRNVQTMTTQWLCQQHDAS